MIPKFISKTEEQIVLFDMDGVLAELIVGEEKDIIANKYGVYRYKRPMMTIVNTAKQLSEMENISVGILSSCCHTEQIAEKKDWLKQYMPFIEDKNIEIIVWNDGKYTLATRKFAKLDSIKRMNAPCKVFLIEDTYENIYAINDEIPNCAHHVSELVD